MIEVAILDVNLEVTSNYFLMVYVVNLIEDWRVSSGG
jgi:hypothetical protein